MEKIMLLNPPKKKRKVIKHNPTIRRSSTGQFVKTRRKKRHNPGELMLINPHKKRSHQTISLHKKTRKHPASIHPFRRHRRRNPSGLQSFVPANLLNTMLWGGAGAIGTVAAGKLFLREYNTGAVGYLGQGAISLAIGWLAGTISGPSAQIAAVTGGVSVIVFRMAEDFGLIGPGSKLGDMGFGSTGLNAYERQTLGAYAPGETLSGGYEEPGLFSYAPGEALSAYEEPGVFDIDAYEEPGVFGDDELQDMAEDLEDDLEDEEMGDTVDDEEINDMEDDELGLDDEF